jgi:hypothetical protein
MLGKKKNHFVVFAYDGHFNFNRLPPALVPLGHHPIICILLKTILDCDKECVITLLVQTEHGQLFENEMKRWFPQQDNIQIFGITCGSSASILLQYVRSIPDTDDDPVILLNTLFPLLCQSTLEHFLAQSQETNFSVLCVNKSRWNISRNLIIADIKKDRVHRLSKKNDDEKTDRGFYFISCMKASKNMLRETLVRVDDYWEIVNQSTTKAFFVSIQSYSIELDSISIDTAADKIYAEHKFVEKQHADYLSHCYCLWNTYKNIDARIEKLEALLHIQDLKK